MNSWSYSSSVLWGSGRSKRPRALSWEVIKPLSFSIPFGSQPAKRHHSENSFLNKIMSAAESARGPVADVANLFSVQSYEKMLAGQNIDFTPQDHEQQKTTRFAEKLKEVNEKYGGLSISAEKEKEILDNNRKLIEGIKQGPLIEARRADIPEDEKERLRKCFTASDSDHTIVINKFSVEMTRSKISCLRPSVWLNDEAINFYMLMLMDRDEKLTEAAGGEDKRRTSHYFNSFFIAKMLENNRYTYANIKRWSKKFDVFKKEKIFMPINIRNTHWTMAVVFVQKKEIHYYDSMSGSGDWYLTNILQWLVDEAREKKNETLDKSEWKLIDREKHVPQQKNGVDCGVFSTICADFLSDDLPLSYDQREMPDYRVKIGCAILRGFITY